MSSTEIKSRYHILHVEVSHGKELNLRNKKRSN
jgi:hypothetical protein